MMFHELLPGWRWTKRPAGPALLLLAALFLAAGAGCDRSYEQRKAGLWLDELRGMEKKLDKAEAMSKYVLYQQVLDRCKQLLDNKALTGAERVEVVGYFADASLKLSANGDREAADFLTQTCRTLLKDPDPQIREIADLSMIELEAQSLFENQRIRNHIDELVLIGQRPDLGPKGAQFAELTQKFQSLWKEVEASGADHAEELEKTIRSLGRVIFDVPLWVGGPKEVEIRYNQLRAHLRDNSLAREIDYSNLLNNLQKAVANNPQSPGVTDKVGTVVDRLIAANLYTQAAQFVETVLPNYAQATDPAVRALRARWEDQAALCKSGVQQRIHDWKKNPGLINDEAIEQLKPSLVELAAGEPLSEVQFQRIAELINTVESSQNHAATAKLVAAVREALGGDANQGPQIQQACQAAESRLAMVGQKFPLPQAAADSGAVAPEDIAGKWVAVVFWKASDPETVDMLDQLELAERLAGFKTLNPLRLAINTDDDLEAARALAQQFKYEWPVLVPKAAENGRNPYAVQYAVDSAPYFMLVNPEGNVAMIGLSRTAATYHLLAHAKKAGKEEKETSDEGDSEAAKDSESKSEPEAEKGSGEESGNVVTPDVDR